MSKRIYLNVTRAVEAFALAHGACFDKAVGWYIEENLPPELEEFAITPNRTRNNSLEYGPACKLCGSHSIQKTNKHGELFWGCSRWPHCRGSAAWNIPPMPHSTDFLTKSDNFSFAEDVKHQPNKRRVLSLEVQDQAKRIVEKAIRLHGGTTAGMKWLETKKVGLNMQTPLEVMHSLDGCAQVERLLVQKFES